MNILPVITPAESLPALIDRATAALDSARNSAEVLEARDMARVAYDAAKSAGRMARAKQAHDSLVVDVHRSQSHALAIRARAEMRLAEEYDDAQDRGEVQKHGGQTPRDVGAVNIPAAADLGIRRDEIHDARRMRDKGGGKRLIEASPGPERASVFLRPQIRKCGTSAHLCTLADPKSSAELGHRRGNASRP